MEEWDEERIRRAVKRFMQPIEEEIEEHKEMVRREARTHAEIIKERRKKSWREREERRLAKKARKIARRGELAAIREKARPLMKAGKLTFAAACRLVACEPNIQRLSEIYDKIYAYEDDETVGKFARYQKRTFDNLKALERCTYEKNILIYPKVKRAAALYASTTLTKHEVARLMERYDVSVTEVSLTRALKRCKEYLTFTEKPYTITTPKHKRATYIE